jgi:ribulose-phosphate 3-epimerase
VEALKAEIKNRGAQALIEIDGGVYEGNVRAVEEAGVDIAVAGSAVFGAPDPAAAISALRGA